MLSNVPDCSFFCSFEESDCPCEPEGTPQTDEAPLLPAEGKALRGSFTAQGLAFVQTTGGMSLRAGDGTLGVTHWRTVQMIRPDFLNVLYRLTIVTVFKKRLRFSWNVSNTAVNIKAKRSFQLH